MYHDVEAMADLQNELLKSGDPVVNLDLNDQSQAIVIDGKEFKPSDGVEIVVQVRGDVVCIRGANEYGDEATWQCVGGK